MDQTGPPVRGRLVLLRHGQSTCNAADVFTGWTDVPLTDLGRAQAAQAGRQLAAAGLRPTSVHTSLLVRAVSTAEIVLAVLGLGGLPVRRTWRLNERHYGALTGRRKREVAAEVDAATFHAWRRSYATAPPPMSPDALSRAATDPWYAGLPPGAVPCTESLADVSARLLPYWTGVLVPELRSGGTPLVVAHGNSLRALVGHLDGLDDRQVAALDIATAAPLVYEFDDLPRPRPASGSRYLDPVTASEPVRTGPALPPAALLPAATDGPEPGGRWTLPGVIRHPGGSR